jgi:hypothetical protein
MFANSKAASEESARICGRETGDHVGGETSTKRESVTYRAEHREESKKNRTVLTLRGVRPTILRWILVLMLRPILTSNSAQTVQSWLHSQPTCSAGFGGQRGIQDSEILKRARSHIGRGGLLAKAR